MIQKPLIILEIANNHMGNLIFGKKIINSYHKTVKPFRKFFDFAIKFQFRDIKTFIHPKFINTDHKQVSRFVDTQLTDKEWKDLISFSKKRFNIICTPFDEKSITKAIKFNFDYIKIASCSSDEWPLLEFLAKKIKKKKVICSLGGASSSQIQKTISFFNNKKINASFLYCVAKYPTNPDNLNLNFFKELRSIYGEQIAGFSTHEIPNEDLSGSLALAMGAKIFEKHVSIVSKKYSINKYSVSPLEFKQWLTNLYESYIRLGSIKKRNKFLKAEKNNLSQFKRGVFLKSGIFKVPGDYLDKNKDIILAFPCEKNQLTSNDLSKFVDIKIKKPLNSLSPILKNNIDISDNRKFSETIRDKIIVLLNRSHVVVQKPAKLEISHHYGEKKFYKFGMCMVTVVNTRYCKKLLFMFNKQFHPAQFHKKKQETFFVLFGKIALTLKIKNKVTKKILNEGDILTIKPNEIHSFKCLSRDGCVIEELSTKSNKEDSFYIDKQISKNKNRKTFISLI